MRFPLIIMAVCLVAVPAAPQPAPVSAAGVEEIYVARSLRESRVPPTAYCAQERIGFGGAVAEDQYTFHSIASRVADALVTSAKERTVGRAHACVAPAANPRTLNFYAEGAIDTVSFKAIGDCRAAEADKPEPGITFYSCFLELRGLPQGYAGGYLTSSTIVSRHPEGETSDPPGYVQSSIATIRLWKRR
jgi:hypothetical protein